MQEETETVNYTRFPLATSTARQQLFIFTKLFHSNGKREELIMLKGTFWFIYKIQEKQVWSQRQIAEKKIPLIPKHPSISRILIAPH